LGTSEDIEAMTLDIIAVGGPDLNPERVKRFVTDLPALGAQLEALGLEFDRDDSGEVVRRSAGGLSSRRILTVGDGIGRPLMKLLKGLVAERCEIITPVRVMGIDRKDSFELRTDMGMLRARSVVVATGGTSYQEALNTGRLTSNLPNENASLRASLEELGLTEIVPRRFQWHPFGLVASRKGITVSCVPESVAALGPRLVADGRQVGQLPAPRMEVVGTMTEIERSGSQIQLTLSEMSEADLHRFPKVRGYIREYGPRPFVTPVLHYELSGYPTGDDQSSGIPGLFLAGEIVGGVHGRERLMGLGVADSLVHGGRAGKSAAEFVREG
jgi:aspartate oxidase